MLMPHLRRCLANRHCCLHAASAPIQAALRDKGIHRTTPGNQLCLPILDAVSLEGILKIGFASPAWGFAPIQDVLLESGFSFNEEAFIGQRPRIVRTALIPILAAHSKVCETSVCVSLPPKSCGVRASAILLTLETRALFRKEKPYGRFT